MIGEVKKVSVYNETQLTSCAESVFKQLGYEIIDEEYIEWHIFVQYTVRKVKD